MAETGYSSLSDILTEDYKEITDQINDDVPIVREMESNSEAVQDRADGKYAVHGLRIGRNQGVQHQSTTDDLPTAGRNEWKRTEIPLRLQSGRGQINVTVMRNLGPAGTIAAVDTAAREVEDLVSSLRRERGRIIFNDGTGKIAQAGTTNNSTTVALTSATETQLLQLEEMVGDGSSSGALLHIGTVADSDAASGASGVRLDAVDTTNGTLTVGTAITTTSSHYVFRKNSGGDTDGTYRIDDGQKEATGLLRLVNDGTATYEPTGGLFNVDPSSVPQWKATVHSNSGTNRQLTDRLLLSAINKQQRISGKTARMYVTGQLVFESFVDYMTSIRRNVEDITSDKGGTSGITFSSLPAGTRSDPVKGMVTWDRDCPENKLFGLCMDSLAYYEDPEGAALFSYDGNQFSRVANKLAVEFTVFGLYEFAVLQRNANFRIDDLAQST